jgi:beta-lactamase class A
MHRRSFHAALATAAWAFPWGAKASSRDPVQSQDQQRLAERCTAIEAEYSCRLGVCLVDVRRGHRAQWRGGERFPMCSTFKWVTAAHVLSRVDAGAERLDRRIAYPRSALVAHSPVTEQHAGRAGLTVAQLCEATITTSDNTAGNLLLEATGGPAGFTHFVREQGDAFTRLDRIEPALNQSRPGDVLDTTTPESMAGLLQRLVLGEGLRPASRRQLTAWMLATRTSGARLRAGLPAGWRLADKTGAGDHGSNNDVGVFWRPNGEPVVASVYLTECPLPMAGSSAAIAALARFVTSAA